MIAFLIFMLATAVTAALPEDGPMVMGEREVVQISEDGQTTVPANSIATPAQVNTVADSAGAAYAIASNLAHRAEICAEKLAVYSTNYVVTSTVYVQSIGGVPFDLSNQTVRICGLTLTPTSVVVLATVRQLPLVPPKLDWRVTLSGGAWSNIASTVASVDVPSGSDAAAAYTFTLPRPAGGSAFFRVVDNSTGVSGSGLWWIVFGGLSVDGKLGWSGSITNGAAIYPFHVGILTEPEPLGGL